jgi:hypothetical protein
MPDDLEVVLANVMRDVCLQRVKKMAGSVRPTQLRAGLH